MGEMVGYILLSMCIVECIRQYGGEIIARIGWFFYKLFKNPQLDED